MKEKNFALIIKYRNFILYILPVILLTLLIFHFSSQPFHKQDIKPYMEILISEERLAEILPAVEFYYGGSKISYKDPYGFTQFFIRKFAHLSLYGVLGFLTVRAVNILMLAGLRGAVLGLVCSVLIACLDEFNQSLSPYRTGSYYDVCLNIIGVFMGIMAFIFIEKLFKKENE